MRTGLLQGVHRPTLPARVRGFGVRPQIPGRLVLVREVSECHLVASCPLVARCGVHVRVRPN